MRNKYNFKPELSLEDNMKNVTSNSAGYYNCYLEPPRYACYRKSTKIFINFYIFISDNGCRNSKQTGISLSSRVLRKLILCPKYVLYFGESVLYGVRYIESDTSF